MANQTITPSKKLSVIACTLMMTLATAPQARELDEQTEPTRAEVNKTNENIGFGTGMVLGAIVAGPIGAVVSSFVGVFTAKHMNVTDERNELTAALSDEKLNYETALQNYQDKMQQAEHTYQQQLLTIQQEQHLASQLQAENLLMSLQFSTGSSELKSHYKAQISSLAKILEQSPNISVDLSGYTDLQGSDELNHALSIARVNSVKNALVNEGVQAERINLFAHGEQAPVVANSQREASFYDRRVVIKLQTSPKQHSNQQTVSNY